MPKKSQPQAVLLGPAMETLFTRRADSYWPREILDNPGLVVQANMRQKLHAALGALYERIPDATTEIADAVDGGVVEAKDMAELYELLAAFLYADVQHARLALYLPFELIPYAVWRPKLGPLKASAETFMRAFMRSWRELLDEADVRANFFDGNILEPELAPNGQTLVCKAAHLIPMLVRKGHLSVAEVLAMRDAASSELLRDSIDDARVALSSRPAPNEPTATFGREWLLELPAHIANELRKFDMREAADYSKGMPPARVAWERKDKQEQLILSCAQGVGAMLAQGIAEWNDILLLFATADTCTRLAAMRGVQMATETLAKTNRTKAVQVLEAFLICVSADWLKVPEVYDELESMLAHSAHLRLISEADLKRFGFRVPRLDGEFAKDGALARELLGYSGVIEKIANDTELSELLYPTAIFFGSRLKGYAKQNADLDAAVFVRPGVSAKQRGKVRRILEDLFAGGEVGGKVVTFWLTESKHGLVVRDFSNPDVLTGDSLWAHLLVGSVWLGQEEVLRELYQKLLPELLHSEGKKLLGRNIRVLWLRELEREVLQYRLMHKGYRRFFAPLGGIDAEAVGLDPKSVFWDSGYRRLASKLFVERVFLPKLPR